MKKPSKLRLVSLSALFVFNNIFGPTMFYSHDEDKQDDVAVHAESIDTQQMISVQEIIGGTVAGAGTIELEEFFDMQKVKNDTVNVQLPLPAEYDVDTIESNSGQAIQVAQDVTAVAVEAFNQTVGQQGVNAEPKYYIELTESEKHELACLIYLEARGESEECQYAVGSVVINRYTATCDADSILDIIYAPGQFKPAKYIKSTTPSEVQIRIVEDLCLNGPTVPVYVTYFRAGRFHNWKSTKKWKQIDATYFSLDRDLYTQVTGCNP